MDIKYRLYPHPVLWEANDDYTTSSFSCSFVQTRDIKKFIIEAEFSLKNDELQALIDNGQAEFIVHIESPASSYRLVEKTSHSNKVIKLSDDNLLGKVSLCPFIVAKENIVSFKNSDWNDDYKDVQFYIEKGTILAIGEQMFFKVNKDNQDLSTVPSIFTIYKKETVEDIPTEIELNDNKIRIGLNIKDYENYFANVNSNQDIVNSFLLYPVLIFAFERIKENFDDYRDYRWFQAIESIFNTYSIKFNEDLFEAKTSLELVQKFMNYPVSKALADLDKEPLNNEEDTI